ncbi:murein transglycosylase super family [Candidatus Termititenax dinenymphae]|uniref:Murein transglycosylase super family n=1 Tax=Candidatus Termititenax dinenymphae TaxID=2218523 RepID=A0A388TMA6_9BACT|nr:murein transglycosylase super family [Candidatus Termititenax dinenymphae]
MLGALIFLIVVVQVATQLPDVDVLGTIVPNETTKIFAADGSVLAELHQEENRVVVPISQISDFVKAAVIATEDSNFYRHNGLDFGGLFRSVVVDVIRGEGMQGGSTITMQLARNIFLNKKKKVIRKIAEMILALQLERRFTKEEILEFYLNQVYWGHNAYGIESASNMYFGKTAAELNLPEAATLIGLLRGPELYSPFYRPQRARWRRDIVLRRLLILNMITEEEFYQAKETPMFLASRRTLRYKHPYFTSYVVKQLELMYGKDVVYNDGLKVYTTLDIDLQRKAEDAVEYYMMEASRPHWVRGREVSSLNATQAALFSVETKTGYIKAWVGGRDFLEREFDHIAQAKRQVGSSFKPYTYLTAISMGQSPGTIIDDSPVTYNTVQGPYSPQNFTKDFKGPVTLKRALELSLNVVAVKISDLINPSNIILTCRKLGIQSYLAPVLSLTLGASDISILEHASAFCTIANGGVRIDPVSILRIEDRNGNVLYKHQIAPRRVFEARHIYALVYMMRGVMQRGTGQGGSVPGYDLAGKTGTTNDFRDAWFMGFSPNLMTAVWMGNDDNSSMQEVTGGWLPAQMWRMYMAYALPKFPKEYFPYPRGMVKQRICVVGKGLATQMCPESDVAEELMWENGVYTNTCQSHSMFGGLVASGTTRSDWERTFFPDTGRIIFLVDTEEKKPTNNPQSAVIPAAGHKQTDSVKIDVNKGL